MALTASLCGDWAPPPLHPSTLNQGQGQPHRWTQSNLQTEIQSNCQTSGHAKTSQQDSFHKHLSRSKKKKEVMAKLYSHIWFICMCLDGQWVRLCADKLSTVSVLASLGKEVKPLMPPVRWVEPQQQPQKSEEIIQILFLLLLDHIHQNNLLFFFLEIKKQKLIWGLEVSH